MKISKIRGTLSAERELYKEIDNEKYFKTHVEIDGQQIPVVASMFVLRDKQGRCEIDCIVRQEPGDGYRCVYLYASAITPCDEKLPDINKIYVGGQVTKVYPTRMIGSASSELNIYKIAWYSDKNANFINVRAMGMMARKLSDTRVGQVLNCVCYMQIYNNKIDFYISEVKKRNTLRKKGRKHDSN